MKIIATAAMACMLLLPSASFAQEPKEAIRGPLEEAIRILRDPAYQEAKEKQREQLWDIVESIFDFEEISRRTLAGHWRTFNEGEKREFTDLFSRLLFNTYLSRVRSEYEDQEVVFTDQEVLDGRATVSTVIHNGNVRTPVEYRLKETGGTWKVYDVYVEGVSLISNYKSQFSSILLNQSPEELIERLRNKVGEVESA